MPVAEAMTAEEFLALPEDTLRWAELVGGEMVVDPPILRHQLICSEILVELALWTRSGADRGLASIELAVPIGDRDVYQPDLVWYRGDRAPARVDRPPHPAPDLSPSTWCYDIGAKKSGAPQFDVALELTRGDTLTSPPLPGFALRLDAVFGE